MQIQCSVPLAKFRDYIFKGGATHGKDAVFRALGYSVQHCDALVQLYTQQAAAKFARGEYVLGKHDQYGQRISIEIELPGIGAAAGTKSFLRSGWMILPGGNLHLNTPFSGSTR